MKRSDRKSEFVNKHCQENKPIITKLSIKINLQLYTVSFFYKCIKHPL